MKIFLKIQNNALSNTQDHAFYDFRPKSFNFLKKNQLFCDKVYAKTLTS